MVFLAYGAGFFILAPCILASPEVLLTKKSGSYLLGLTYALTDFTVVL